MHETRNGLIDQRRLPSGTPVPGASLRRPPGRLRTAVRASIAAAALLVPLRAHALFGDDEARRAILDARRQIEELREQSHRQLDEIARRQSALETRVEALEQGQRGLLDQQNKLEELRAELARVRGHMEVLANDMAQIRGGATNPAAPPAEGAPATDPASDNEGRAQSAAPPAVNTVSMMIDGRSVALEPAEKQAYELGVEQFRKGDFKKAAASLQAFLKSRPESALTPMAQYWLGGAQYAQGDFKGAISTLRQMTTQHPRSGRAADALLLMGNAQNDAGDRKAARETYRAVVDRYASTAAATTARDRLSTLK